MVGLCPSFGLEKSRRSVYEERSAYEERSEKYNLYQILELTFFENYTTS